MKHLIKYAGVIFFLVFINSAVAAISFKHTSNIYCNYKQLIINEYPGIYKIFETDSVLFAKVIIYRPDNQLKRPYHFQTTGNNIFSLKKHETKNIDVFSKDFEINVSATGHKTERFSFTLSNKKTHYLRVQDRNNYAGTRPLLEIIEVTEETYKNDLN